MRDLETKMIAHCLAVKDEKRLIDVITHNSIKSAHIKQILSDNGISSNVLNSLIDVAESKLDLCRIVVHSGVTQSVIMKAKKRINLLVASL